MDILQNTPAGIEQACNALRAGKLVIWPSPLWYGLSTSALDPAAVSRLYRAKRRDAREALLLLTQGAEDADRYGQITPVAARLIEVFWPGFLVGQSVIGLQKGRDNDTLWLMDQSVRGKQAGIRWEDDRKQCFAP